MSRVQLRELLQSNQLLIGRGVLPQSQVGFISLVTGFYSRVGIKEVHLVYFITVFSELFKELNTVPLLALFNRQTPPHLEATAISFFSSIFSLSKLVSTMLGALLGYAFAIHSTNYAHMYPIVLIQCAFTTLTTLCIFFLKFPAARSADLLLNDASCPSPPRPCPIRVIKVVFSFSLIFRLNPKGPRTWDQMRSRRKCTLIA